MHFISSLSVPHKELFSFPLTSVPDPICLPKPVSCNPKPGNCRFENPDKQTIGRMWAANGWKMSTVWLAQATFVPCRHRIPRKIVLNMFSAAQAVQGEVNTDGRTKATGDLQSIRCLSAVYLLFISTMRRAVFSLLLTNYSALICVL